LEFDGCSVFVFIDIVWTHVCLSQVTESIRQAELLVFRDCQDFLCLCDCRYYSEKRGSSKSAHTHPSLHLHSDLAVEQTVRVAEGLCAWNSNFLLNSCFSNKKVSAKDLALRYESKQAVITNQSKVAEPEAAKPPPPGASSARATARTAGVPLRAQGVRQDRGREGLRQ